MHDKSLDPREAIPWEPRASPSTLLTATNKTFRGCLFPSLHSPSWSYTSLGCICLHWCNGIFAYTTSHWCYLLMEGLWHRCLCPPHWPLYKAVSLINLWQSLVNVNMTYVHSKEDLDDSTIIQFSLKAIKKWDIYRLPFTNKWGFAGWLEFTGWGSLCLFQQCYSFISKIHSFFS